MFLHNEFLINSPDCDGTLEICSGMCEAKKKLRIAKDFSLRGITIKLTNKDIRPCNIKL